MRPRVWLYDDYDYADTTAIAMVSASDLRSKPDAVIVVGTALKVESRRKFAIDMCAAVRKCGGLSPWINLEPPSQPLKCFDIVIKGDSDSIAVHVSSWWLKDCRPHPVAPPYPNEPNTTTTSSHHRALARRVSSRLTPTPPKRKTSADIKMATAEVLTTTHAMHTPSVDPPTLALYPGGAIDATSSARGAGEQRLSWG
ncbi:hypothetical protein VC83_07151 [Pseudogymnoascus destructans]|uniref:Deacetylase sirtuin-type domain-containing protein n=1 Tax=Pseudogymnoascus destructans TaxID=655981 RepID=A0A177A505_9PEZI|nr:uncharacterized protein VC83_07151 [Pseudogymnoascus destructans]OAF56690.1 hypothetical protein VC83_07151 [Pseudogymnoascus destructans]